MRRLNVSRNKLLAAVVLIGSLGASSAQADIFNLTLGIRGGAGAQFLNEPANKVFDVPGTDEQFIPPFFEGLRAGHHYTLGWYAEMRFYEYVGLEFGLNITRKFLSEEIDWEYTQREGSTITGGPWKATTEQNLTFAGTQIPIMVKGVLPIQGARIWLGLGPEFWIGQWSSTTKREVTRLDAGTPGEAPVNVFQDLRARNVTDTYLTWALGFDVQAGALVIPIVLKFGYNLTNPDNYAERVDFFPGFPEGEGEYPSFARIRATDSFYGQILIGFAYDVL
jgi:hypothetical protein